PALFAETAARYEAARAGGSDLPGVPTRLGAQTLGGSHLPPPGADGARGPRGTPAGGSSTPSTSPTRTPPRTPTGR
ncbi:hypothetical protein ACFV0D_19100, partial [Streptomyces sp. NPDC059556]